MLIFENKERRWNKMLVILEHFWVVWYFGRNCYEINVIFLKTKKSGKGKSVNNLEAFCEWFNFLN